AVDDVAVVDDVGVVVEHALDDEGPLADLRVAAERAVAHRRGRIDQRREAEPVVFGCHPFLIAKSRHIGRVVAFARASSSSLRAKRSNPASLSSPQGWIASSLTLLAMTAIC